MDKSKNHDGGTGRVYGGESLVDRTARRRQQFLDAGLAIFGTSGYRSATVRMLCKQAQLTDRYFYESFDSAEDLLMAVYLQCIERMQGAVLTELMSAPPSGDIKAIIVKGLDLFFTIVSDARVARVCWLEVLGVSRRVDAMYNDTLNAFASVGLIFARAQFPAWVLDDEEAQVLSVAVVGAVSQSVTHWLLGDYRESKATMVAATSRVFFGLLATVQEG